VTADASGGAAIQFTVARAGGKIVDVQTNSPEINHFLRLLKLSRAHNTWLNYALDLKLFFQIVQVPPEQVGRPECLTFIEHQDREGRADATINRRLAAISSLFDELHLLDPERFPHNPVFPFQRSRYERRRRSSLYRKQGERVPDVLATEQLQTLFASVHTWRDRTLILLMWVSCLRISEALAIRFDDIECSDHSIHIRAGKGNHPRTVYMDALTLEALNRYLNHERRELVPEEPHVFVALKGRARGQPLSANSVQKLLAYHAKHGHLDMFHAHLLRHTGITQLIQAGMSEPAVRKLVGHRHPASLEPYLHLNDAFVAEEFATAQQGLDITIYRALLTEGGAA
jgi:site-specific recombinase XerD